MTEDRTSQAFFEAKYRQAADPWDFATSAYEQDRYTATIQALCNRKFSRAFEPGCSIGVLTERLARICERVDAIDIAPSAVRMAQERCRDYPNVTIRQGVLPVAMPGGSFDLIVFSEIGYYFDPATLATIAGELVGCLRLGAVFLAVHWLGASPDHRLSGDRVHDILSLTPGLQLTERQRHDSFRLDRWNRI
jgi:SAM-dependent methyltransferase